jgi:hypothetical protein
VCVVCITNAALRVHNAALTAIGVDVNVRAARAEALAGSGSERDLKPRLPPLVLQMRRFSLLPQLFFYRGFPRFIVHTHY